MNNCRKYNSKSKTFPAYSFLKLPNMYKLAFFIKDVKM